MLASTYSTRVSPFSALLIACISGDVSTAVIRSHTLRSGPVQRPAPEASSRQCELSRQYVRFSNNATSPVFHYDAALRQTRFSGVTTPYIITKVTDL